MKYGGFFTLMVFALAASSAHAAVDVSLSANPVNCKDPFKIMAKFNIATANMQVVFSVDGKELEAINLRGETASETTISGESAWDRLKPGSHTAKAVIMQQGAEVDSGELEFQVAGTRCPLTTTTTTTSTTTTTIRYNCTSNIDCASPVTGPPQCSGDDIIQELRWGECENASTLSARCIDKSENATLKSCGPLEACVGGECKTRQAETTTTSTTIQEPTSTSIPEPTTTSTSSTSTTTATTQTSTTQKGPEPIFQRTNTRLDRLIEAFEAIIRLVMFWK
jgi:hypothetical protein